MTFWNNSTRLKTRADLRDPGPPGTLEFDGARRSAQIAAMNQPKRISGASRLGVAVPVGAWDERLPAALRSIVSLGEARVALLDASADPRVAEAADASGLVFSYRRHGPDSGQSAAIQEGWDNLPDADILCWLNADDLLFADGVAEALEAFEADPDLDVHYSESTIIDAQGSTVGVHPQVLDDPALLLKACTISQPSCFVRRSAVEAVGGVDPDLEYTMDWDLWARLYLAGRRFRKGRGFASAVFWGAGTKTSQFNAARVSEIIRLTARLSGPLQALKALYGLSVHHAIEAVSAHRPARLTLTPGVPVRLPVPNMTPGAASRLEVAMDARAGAVSITAPGAMGASTPQGARLEFDHPVAAGGAVWLELAAQGPARLLSCAWRGEPEAAPA
jgi:hypothetical protein